ncbi:MAG: PEP-CTERM sorting domain-containing protein [Burkholderiales bacterium]
MKKILIAALGALAVSLPVFIAPANAAAPAAGVYDLHNHPDGGAAAPYYGLRLDELINVSSGHDIFTFDFDHASSFMQLSWNGSSIHIYGQAYGGLDTGSAYGNPLYRGVWDIDFTYDTGIGVNPHNVEVTANMVNEGTISSTFGLGTFDLVDKSNGDFSFKLGSEDNGSPHRGFAGISGWGWMNHSGAGLDTHVAASDWLFTATIAPVPEPEVYAMLGLGLGFLGWTRRRQKKLAA